MTAPLLELIDVHAGYGRINVLHGVNLRVPKGKVFALLGPNGAGKSTTVQVASGRVVPTSGCLHVAGNHVNGAPPAALARAGVCTIPEGRGIFPNLTVDENLWVATNVSDAEREAVRDQAFTSFPPLGQRQLHTLQSHDDIHGTIHGADDGGEGQTFGLVSPDHRAKA